MRLLQKFFMQTVDVYTMSATPPRGFTVLAQASLKVRIFFHGSAGPGDFRAEETGERHVQWLDYVMPEHAQLHDLATGERWNAVAGKLQAPRFPSGGVALYSGTFVRADP